MINKIAFTQGNIVDQYIGSGDIITPLYAHVTDNKKSMHHGKAMAIGAGIGAAGGGVLGLSARKAVNSDLFRHLGSKLTNKAELIEKIPRYGLLVGALTGALAGLGYNSRVRTFRAANRSNEKK